MPLNMNDPYLRAERQPPAIVALGVRLKAHYGVGADAFGIKGNDRHYSGYHRSRDFLERSPLGNGGDYSTRGALNRGGNGANNCAFDFVPAAWGTSRNHALMIELTRRAYDAACRNDPRLADWYEFAGTLDGEHVVTFYAQGGAFKTPFDSSHLEHLHGSKWRARADNDDTGLGDVLLGIVTQEDEDDMGASFGPIEIQREGLTSLTIPPVLAGAADPRPAWLNFCNDTGRDYGLRIWYASGTDESDSFAPFPGTVGGLLKLRSGQRWSQEIPAGTACLSIMRQPVAEGGEVFAGHLTCAIERGAVVKK